MWQITLMTSTDTDKRKPSKVPFGPFKKKGYLLAGTSAITANQVIFQLEVQIFLARFMI